MPVLAIPALLRGRVDETLLDTALIGLAVFVVASVLGRDAADHRPSTGVGRPHRCSASATGCAARPSRCSELPERLLRERDRLLGHARTEAGSARCWPPSGAGRSTTCTLLAALAAIGSHPRAGLVLLAFCGAQVLSQIPITPGGLGFVEAGLTAMLALAGVSAGDAVVATFAYRLFSYWLPLPLGLVGFALQPRATSTA